MKSFEYFLRVVVMTDRASSPAVKRARRRCTSRVVRRISYGGGFRRDLLAAARLVQLAFVSAT